MSANNETNAAICDLGITGRFVLNVIPITEILSMDVKITKQGTLCRIDVKGNCKNIPDGQNGSLKFSNQYSDGSTGKIFTNGVKIKTTGDKEIRSYELLDSNGKELLIDPLTCGFVGKGKTTLELDLVFPFTPTFTNSTPCEFNFPFDISIEKSGTDRIGSLWMLRPVYDSIFNGCECVYSMVEDDSREIEFTMKGNKDDCRNYAVSLNWESGNIRKKSIFAGCSEDHKLAYTNLFEMGDFEIKQQLTIKRKEVTFNKELKTMVLPKPQLRSFEVFIGAAPFEWLFTPAASIFFADKTAPKNKKVFSVRGLFSGFDDDTALNIEVILLAMEDEKIIAWFDTIRQVFDIDEDGSFRGIIGELLDEQIPASDNKKLTFVAAVRIAESSLIKSPVPVLQTFTSSEYLPLSSIYGADIVPDADSWMVSSPVSYDGKILPARKSLLTLEEFKSIIPEAKDANLAKYLPYINETLEIYQINTKVRMAHFLCHIPVETGNLEFFKEINNTSKWKGRGLIHLTSESNYKGFAEFMKNPEIVKNPDLVATDPVHACHSAGWWWCKSTNVDTNTLADKEDFIGIVLKVNNLANGLQHRWEALKRAYAVFNLENREQRIAAMYAAMKNKGYRNV